MGDRMEENRSVKIYSYKKVWKVEKKIYSISNINLPIPVNPYDLLVFLGVAIIMLILGRIIPAVAAIPTVIRFVMIPYGIAHYLMKMKLDGKNPFKFWIGCIIYFFTTKGYYIQLFKGHPDKKEKIVLKWQCSRGI